jgi:predicted nucleotidyltransferase/DNA-binding XRE family transcriptional regulator
VDAGPLLRDARIRAGLSQRELAARAATSQPAVNRYELGHVQPRADTLERLLAACGSGIGRPVPVENATPAPFLGPVGYLLAAHRARVLELAASAGALNVWVFGSVARAQDHDSSDLDLLVDLAPGRTLLDLAGLTEDLRKLLGISVDVATPDILKPHIRANALAEARRL